MIKKRGTKSTDYFILKEINPVIRILTFCDLIVISAFGLITPIFAIFITQSIDGGTIEVAGIAYAVLFLSESIFQIPLATIIDKIKGEKDDFLALVIGSIIFSVVPILYIFISTPIELYIVQFIYGFALAMTGPSWYAIFTRHIDRRREGLEWGIYRTLTSLGSAIAASLGGFLITKFGFDYIFILISALSFVGSIFIISVKSHMKTGKILRN
ncbi:MAG: MFS transporter [Candidatus Falkowbacteria bacterium]